VVLSLVCGLFVGHFFCQLSTTSTFFLKHQTSSFLLVSFQGESLVREDDAIRVIEEHGESTSVILIPGIQYYTGQLFNIPLLTKVAHSKGIIVGSDLAHAVGNVPLHLHDWEVDFAAWCTYKYLNAGAGSIAGIYVHDKWTSEHEHTLTEDFPMLKGWWGNTPSTKFSMKDDFEAASGADMFKLSNPPAILCAMLMASLDIYSQTSMQDIARKQFLLTGYLEYLLRKHFQLTSSIHTDNNERQHLIQNLPSVEIITPSDPQQRGSQLSICFSIPLACVQDELKKRGIVVCHSMSCLSFCGVFKRDLHVSYKRPAYWCFTFSCDCIVLVFLQF
jgi:kynureninase